MAMSMRKSVVMFMVSVSNERDNAEGLIDLVTPKRCDVDCGLGQECQWISGEEMCVCSEESCHENNSPRRPLCASNNMTFSSECVMEAWKCTRQQSGLYKKYDGECQSKSQERVINRSRFFYF